jgi:hypothetical protein
MAMAFDCSSLRWVSSIRRGIGSIAKCGGSGLGFKVVDGGGAAARGLASVFSGFGGVAPFSVARF